MNIPKSVWWLVIGIGVKYYWFQFFVAFKYYLYETRTWKKFNCCWLVLMINSFGMVIGNLLGGSLFDKLGGYKTILIELSLVFVVQRYLISFTGGLGMLYGL
ncbi:Multidrug resistance protein [Staphylococcus aureus]|nr:Multidrug resistance protein [Staphylococcus aureus]